MKTEIYKFYGIDTAVFMLRPGAKWEWTGGVGFTRWDDPRPCPSKEEVEGIKSLSFNGSPAVGGTS